MKLKKNNNPIKKELKKLKLISDSNLVVINRKTRDAKIKVLQDRISKVIFLEKYIRHKNYYSSLKNKTDFRKISEKSERKIAFVQTMVGDMKTPIINDDIRRSRQFKKLYKNKNILDFGCGWGGFLKNIKNAKSLNGVELGNQQIKFIKKNIKNVNISNNINSFSNKFDIITLFHVLEHIPYQVKTLKLLKSKLKKKGKIIIEVPHAEDFLIQQEKLTEFKNFIFWSEHLVLHTYNSIKTILYEAGFKKVKITFFQRHNLANHLGWFLEKKPGGQKTFEKLVSKKLNKVYEANLENLHQTDTLIAIAEH